LVLPYRTGKELGFWVCGRRSRPHTQKSRVHPAKNGRAGYFYRITAANWRQRRDIGDYPHLHTRAPAPALPRRGREKYRKIGGVKRLRRFTPPIFRIIPILWGYKGQREGCRRVIIQFMGNHQRDIDIRICAGRGVGSPYGFVRVQRKPLTAILFHVILIPAQGFLHVRTCHSSAILMKRRWCPKWIVVRNVALWHPSSFCGNFCRP